MSHYNSFSKNSIKKYSNSTSSYLGKKRSDYDIDQPKRRYDYEDKYIQNDKFDRKERYERPDRYDRYYKDSSHQSKYHLIKDYSQNYFHNNSTNYRSNRDGFYGNKYYYQGNKSPRGDFKKPYQKYSNESEGVRNLSHCEIPSPKKKEDNSNEKEGLLRGFLNNVNEFVSGQFTGQQTNFQHSFQNQQNININVISPHEFNFPKKSKKGYSNSFESKMREKERETQKVKEKIKESNDDKKEKECPFPKPLPKKEIESFQRDSIQIERNPYEDFNPLPSFQISPSNQVIRPIKSTISLQPGYLLSKLHNWKLLSNFISFPQLAEEKFDNIQIDFESKTQKINTVYAGDFDEKALENIASKRIKLKKEALVLMQAIQYSSFQMIKIKKEIYEKEWKVNAYDIKTEEIDKAIEEIIH